MLSLLNFVKERQMAETKCFPFLKMSQQSRVGVKANEEVLVSCATSFYKSFFRSFLFLNWKEVVDLQSVYDLL